MIAEGGEDVLTFPLADGIRRSHVSWEESKNRVERNLIPHHLVGELGVGHLTCVLVRPSVAGNLVALGMHPLDYGGIRRGRIVDHAFTDIRSGEEECCFGSIAPQLI